MSSQASRQILFVDWRVAELEALLEGVAPEFEIVVLDAGRDGLVQIAEALSGRTGIEAVHVYSHGGPGWLELGSGRVDAGVLASQSAIVKTLRGALAEEADLLLYGCDVGAGDVGSTFMSMLADMTSADVAASSDLTGAEGLGGNWILELVTGPIEVTSLGVWDYQALLVTSTLLGSASDTFHSGIRDDGGVVTDATADTDFDQFTFVLSGIGSYQELSFVHTGLNDPDIVRVTFNGTTVYDNPSVNASGEITIANRGDGTYVVTAGSDGTAAEGGKTHTVTAYGLITDQPLTWGGPADTTWSGSGVKSYNWATGANDPDSAVTYTYVGGMPTGLSDPLNSQNPGVSQEGTYTISVQASSSSNVVNESFTLTIASANDSPSSASASTTLLEDNAVTLSGWTPSFSDPDLGSLYNTLAGVRIDSLPSHGVLTLGGSTVSAGTYIHAGSIGQLTYTPDTHYNSSVSGNDSFTFRVYDGAAYSASAYTMTLAITEVNDRPSFTKGADVTVKEDAAAQSIASWATAISAGPTTDETSGQSLSFTVTNDNSVLFSVQPAISASGTLTFTPAADQWGTAAVTVTLKDSGGTANGGLDTASASQTFTLTLLSVADAPLTLPKSIALNEDTPRTLTMNDIAFTDQKDAVPALGAANTFVSVRIASLPTAGTLTLSGTALDQARIDAGVVLTAADLDAGRLVYVPAANDNGNRTFTVQVRDNGSTDNGGINLDPTPDTITLAIRSINDAPTFSSSAVSLTVADQSSGPSTLSIASGTLVGTDLQGAPGENNGPLVYGVSGGTLASGVSTRAGTYGSLSVNTASGAWSYARSEASINALPAGATRTETFTVSVTDSLGALGTQVFTVNLSGANDSPVGVDDSAVAVEAGGQGNAEAGTPASGNVLGGALLTGAGADTDPDAGDKRSVTELRRGAVEGSGDLASQSGTTFTLEGLYGTLTLEAGGGFTYAVNETLAAVQALASATDTLVDRFNYQVSDTAGLADRAVLSITIQGADDLPTVSGLPSSFSVVQATASPLSLKGLSVADPDGGAAAIELTLSTLSGTLAATVNGQTVTVGGSGTTSLVVAGSMAAINAWLAATDVVYTGPADLRGLAADALTFQYGIGGGTPATLGTSALNITGVNRSPTELTLRPLAAVAEDAASPSGASISQLVQSFADPDVASDVLAGVAISADASTPDQGQWQYSTDAGVTWLGLGSVGTTSALLLGASSRLRFLPAVDWNGTPGALTVHAVDSSGAIATFTQGAVRQTYAMAGAGGSSPVSTASSSLGTSVTAVNDAPLITSAAPGVTISDTAAADTPAESSGTLQASDLHAGAPGEGQTPLSFAIVGGTVAAGLSQLRGVYGALALDTRDGTWTFSPDSAAINALRAGSFTQTFVLTAADSLGATSSQTFTVRVTGANDSPLAVDDLAFADEAGGVGNATPGSAASGQLLKGTGADSDVDSGDTLTVTAVRRGDSEGSGQTADWGSGAFALRGAYGTLTVEPDGRFTYVVDDDLPVVQALASAADTLVDTFNYQVSDAAGASDLAVLRITVRGADDFATIGGFPAAITAVEDVDQSLSLGASAVDPDGGGDAFVLRIRADLGVLAASAQGQSVTITGNGSSTVFVAGTVATVHAWLQASDHLVYRGATNLSGSKADTLTFAGGRSPSGNFSVISAASVSITPANDAPTGGAQIIGAALWGRTLYATQSLADPDGLGPLSYQWLADGVDIPGATTDRLLVLPAMQGKSLAVRVSYTDAGGTAESVLSAATTAVASGNSPPAGALSIGGSALQGQVLTAMTHDMEDPDGLGALAYQWLADGAVIAGATQSTLLLTRALVGQRISLLVSYTDGLGLLETVSAPATSAVLPVNAAPGGAVAIDGLVRQGQTLTARHTLADADGLGTVVWQWLADGAAIPGATDSTLTLTQAQVGRVIAVRASYVDGFGTAEAVISAATAAVANVNDAPTGTVSIAGTAVQGDTLQARHTLADADGLGTVVWQWLADGAAIAGATGSTLTLTQAQVGRVIAVRASYGDGFGTAEAVISAATAAVANVNDAPTGTVSIAGTAAQGRTLEARHTLADADGLGTVVWQWLANGVPIAGATASTLALTQAQVGQAISVQASYVDGQGTPEAVTSPATSAVADANDAPTGTVTISGAAAQGRTLTASHTLADADGLGTVVWQWLADGVAIPGATGSALALTQAQVGKTITARASYIDGAGLAESMDSSPTGPVANVNDAPTGTVSIAGTAVQGDTLEARHTLADADGLGSVGWQWLADGAVIPGATGSTLTLTQALVGQAISVRASYVDGFGTPEALSSAVTAAVRAVAIGNQAPTGTVSIAGTAVQGSTLVASHTLADADGLGPVGWQWLADGAAIPGATGPSLELTQALVGRAVSVRAAYIDGAGVAESSTSAATAPVANVNDAPAGAVSIAGTAVVGGTLVASHALADADGLGTVGWQWLADGAAIAGATGSSLTLTQALVGRTITVRASFVDGFGTAEAVSSPATPAVRALDVGNQAPVAVLLQDVVDGLREDVDTSVALRLASIVIVDDGLGRVSVSLQGADAARFEVREGALYLKSGTPLDFETQATYSVQVRVSDPTLADSAAVQATYQLWLINTAESTPPGTLPPSTDLPPRVTWSSLPDDDADGAPGSVENLAPALTLPGAMRGDGNGDGVADALQVAVLSQPLALSSNPQSAPASTAQSFVTLVAGSVSGKVDGLASSPTQLLGLQQRDFTAGLPAEASMPFGMISFQAQTGQAGKTEHFSLYVDAGLGINGYWKVDASGTWINLASAPYGGAMMLEGGRLRLDFQITDGGRFDADGRADGVISDPGAPGYIDPSLVGSPPVIPPDGLWL